MAWAQWPQAWQRQQLKPPERHQWQLGLPRERLLLLWRPGLLPEYRQSTWVLEHLQPALRLQVSQPRGHRQPLSQQRQLVRQPECPSWNPASGPQLLELQVLPQLSARREPLQQAQLELPRRRLRQPLQPSRPALSQEFPPS